MEDRIDYNETRLDDVVINDVDMFRLEYMDDNSIWLCCYKKSGERIVFDLSSETAIIGKHYCE